MRALSTTNLVRQDLEELARTIKRAREDKHLTQEQLAGRVGVSTQHLRRLESPAGGRVPSAFVVARIAKILGRSTDYFLGHIHTQEDLVEAELKEAERTGAFKKLGLAFAGYTDMSFEAKREVLNVIRMAVKKSSR